MGQHVVNLLTEATKAMDKMRKLKHYELQKRSEGHLLAPIKKWQKEWQRQPSLYPFTINSLAVTITERMS